MRKLNIKLIGLCTALTLLTVSSCVFAANYIGRSTEESEKRFETFGVINNNSQTFNSDGTLTRGKMCEIITRIYGYGNSQGYVPYEETYADVSAETADYSWILIAKNNGWINGDENSNFRPNDNITEIEAVKMLLSTAGYDWLANMCGGYPEGYRAAAKILLLTEETGDILSVPITKDKLLKILNAYLEIYSTRIDDNGVVVVSQSSERSQTDGKMYDGLRLKQKNIADPFN